MEHECKKNIANWAHKIYWDKEEGSWVLRAFDHDALKIGYCPYCSEKLELPNAKVKASWGDVQNWARLLTWACSQMSDEHLRPCAINHVKNVARHLRKLSPEEELQPPKPPDVKIKVGRQHLEQELAVTDKLLKARNETLALIPECPVHGPQCQPHMREWIEKARLVKARSISAAKIAKREAANNNLHDAVGFLRREGFRGWACALETMLKALEVVA